MEQFYNSRVACLGKRDALLFSNNQNAPIVRIADQVEPIFQLFPRTPMISGYAGL